MDGRNRGIADTEFASWLDGQLKEHDMGVRTLARKMAADDVERVRRALNRYLLEGSYPNHENRALIAAALDVPEDDLPDAPFRAKAA